MLTRDELIELSKINLEDVNKNELKEITDIHIDQDSSIDVRFETFLAKIKNPYIFLVNGTPVQIIFDDHNSQTLDDCLLKYLIERKNLDNM